MCITFLAKDLSTKNYGMQDSNFMNLYGLTPNILMHAIYI